MDGSCPCCRTHLTLPASGRYQCERCGAAFEVALGSATPPPMQAPPAAWAVAPRFPTAEALLGSAGAVGAVSGAPCAAHPEAGASGACERCGDFMCALCTTWVEGRMYCPKCFDLLFSRGAFGFTQRSFTEPQWTLGIGLGAVAILIFFPVAFCVAVAGLVLGTRTLRTHGQRPDLPGRMMTVWGTALSGLALAGSLAIGVWLIWLGMK